MEMLKPRWFDWPEVKRVVGLFEATGVPICFVGGCVRDAVAGKTPNDIDIVTPKPLPEVQGMLARAGIESVALTAKFNLIRAYINDIQFDFMYPQQHCPDASFEEATAFYSRSVDFTLNTLWLLPSGELRDPFGGKADIEAGRVRFLGDPEAQISKDHRRIIRFFRFYATFGQGNPDAVSLNACRTHASDILLIHRFNALDEVKRLLSIPSPHKALALMQQHGVLKYALGFPITGCVLIGSLERVEAIRHIISPWQVRLILLVLSAAIPPEQALAHMTQFLALDEATAMELSQIMEYFIVANVPLSPTARQELSVQLNAKTISNILLVRWAMEEDVAAKQAEYMDALTSVAGGSLGSVFMPPWLQWPEVQRMLGLFSARDIACCFIGGCVRDALVGDTPNDFDLLVDLPLEKITALLTAEHIEHKVLSGAWGAVRAYVNDIEFEILYVYGTEPVTGRPFQDAIHIWLDYADFTINSLYLFPNGELHDPTGGKEDLEDGFIRFAGKPESKLRKETAIIRFFRFYAWYGKREPDANSLRVCVDRASALLQTPRVNIFNEMRKLLSAPQPQAALRLMQEHKVLKYAMGFSIHDLALLDAAGRVDAIRGEPSPWQVRLVLLLRSASIMPEKGLAYVSSFWTMDEAISKDISKILEHMAAIDAGMELADTKRFAAQLGADTVRNILLIRWAMEDDVTAKQEAYLRALAV